jgi:hypothetical protein
LAVLECNDRNLIVRMSARAPFRLVEDNAGEAPPAACRTAGLNVIRQSRARGIRRQYYRPNSHAMGSAKTRSASDNSYQHFTDLDEKAFFPRGCRCRPTVAGKLVGISKRPICLSAQSGPHPGPD